MTKKLAKIAIPEGTHFADLGLSRSADGSVKFSWQPIDAICAASGLDPSLFRDAPEENVAGLVIAWYHAARENGEPPDPTAEDLIEEARLEDQHGGGFSLPPGTA